MATTSATGATGGSQIDVSSLAQQLVAAERAPLDAQIARETTRVTTQVSAIGSLMGSLATFRNTVSAMKTVDVFASRQATSSAPEMFTASANATAAPGTYDVEIVNLATAHQISSSLFAGGSTQVVGTGTLTLTLGSSSVAITVDSSNSTLAGIRDAINAAPKNPGIRATIVREGDGAHLVLTSQATGAAQKIQVAQTGGNGGLSQLAYSQANQANYTQLKPAQDAVVRVATYQSTSSTNVVSTAIDGVTLNLLGSTEGATKQLTIAYDRSAVAAKINSFVSAYNAVEAQVAKLGGYNSATKTGGALLGDSMLTSIENQLRRTLQAPVIGVSSRFATLASIGITTQADGTLTVDNAKLQSALSSNLDEVSRLFGGENGIATKLFTQADNQLKTNGALDVRSKNLVQQQRVLSDRKVAVDIRMETVRANYVRQFTTLDRMLSSMQTTSSFLSQQFDQLAALAKSK
jgi:flagellar hook-associated protein 2